MTAERQITRAPQGHILTNTSVWTSDGQWIVYDCRSDEAGARFDGRRIERVHVASGEIQVVYDAQRDACCGVVTCHPTDDRVVFIHGPEDPTADWGYAAYRRRGVLVDLTHPGHAWNLDARSLLPPFTPGALRGGTHLHTFSGDGLWVSFTYEDLVLATATDPRAEPNQRNVGVAIPGAVTVPATHPRNHSGSHFSVLVSTTVRTPRPGSDEIQRAYGDAWVGRDGYLRPDGSRQPRALAFLGDLIMASGTVVTELFLVDLPPDLRQPGAEPLEGTAWRRPAPPAGTVQRRLTRTTDRRYPGIQGPRHWPRSAPDGSLIAICMRDEAGIVQLWTVSPRGDAPPRQVTHHAFPIDSAFSWHPDGSHLAYVADGSVWLTAVPSGTSLRITPRTPGDRGPRPEACVISPHGRQVAYVARRPVGDAVYNQIFVAELPALPPPP